MGRKTYQSFPERFRPLSDRVNIIISRDKELRQYGLTTLSLQLESCSFRITYMFAVRLMKR